MLQEDGEELFVLGCKHHGQVEMLTQWLQTNGSCPTCRSKELRLDKVLLDEAAAKGDEEAGKGAAQPQPEPEPEPEPQPQPAVDVESPPPDPTAFVTDDPHGDEKEV